MSINKFIAFSSILAFPALSFASLIGDIVQGDLSLAGGNSTIQGCPNSLRLNISSPFNSPQTVSAAGAPEFAGSIGVCTSVNPTPVIEDTDWFADIHSNQIVYSIGPSANDMDVVISLSDLDWVNFPAGTIVGISVLQDALGLSIPPTFGAHSVVAVFGRTSPNVSTLTTTLQLNVSHGTPIPEPATTMLLLLGLAGLGTERFLRGSLDTRQTAKG